MTLEGINQLYCILVLYSLLVFTSRLPIVRSEIVQEYLPRSVSAFGDGLENGQLLQIPIDDLGNPVVFSFYANVTKGCSWTNLTLFLRHDGLPIVNVYNASYPNFTWVYQPIDYQQNFLSDGQQQSITIYPSKPSSVVFGVVFHFEDSSPIQQQGLTKSCTTLFWGRVERLLLNVSSFLESQLLPEKSVVQLVRKNSVQPLSAKWVLAYPINGDGNISASTDSNINLGPSNLPTNLAWTVVSPIDVGGTLQVDIKFNKDERNSSVHGCLTYETLDCINGSSFSANSSEVNSKATVIVPYPLAGDWYLSLSGNCTE